MTCRIIAEAGVNHNGSEDTAMQLIDAAFEAGADIVKFQTFKADELVQKGTKKAFYQQERTGLGDQFNMLKDLELPIEAFKRLSLYCKEVGVEFMSTGFSINIIDELCNLGMNQIKVPSGELTNKPYIEHIASKNMAIILSTGMATMEEVADAVSWIRSIRKKKGFETPLSDMLTLLQCSSIYPAPLESVNLRAMEAMADEFGVPVGYSDHTSGIFVPSLAVAMGAVVVEKHFTLDHRLPGPDHQASIEPGEFKKMVKNIRDVEMILGNGIKAPNKIESDVKKLVRRGLVLNRAIESGEVIASEDITLLRPEGTITPKDVHEVVGKKAFRFLQKGKTLNWEDLEL